MENKELNIAKILKDCPKGMKLYATTIGECVLKEVTDKNGNFPIIVQSAADMCPYSFTAYGKFYDIDEGECVLFPSKDNRDWDTFNVRQNFKKGDFVARVFDVGDATILLMGDTDWSSTNNPVRYICYVDLCSGAFCVSKSTDWGSVKIFYDDDRYRFSTDDEKKKLLDAIDKHGYVWDEEKLELCKKEYEFKPFDKVLFRNHGYVWSVGFFSHKTVELGGNAVYYNIGGFNYDECIPYEGNEHLLGTTDSPNEE